MVDRAEIEAQIDQMVDIMTDEYVLTTIHEFASDPDILRLSTEEKADLFHQRLGAQELVSRGIALPTGGLRISSRVFEDESPRPAFRFSSIGEADPSALPGYEGRRVEISEDYILGDGDTQLDVDAVREDLRQAVDSSGMAARIENFINNPSSGQPQPPQDPGIAPFAACICGGFSPLCAGYGS